MTTRLIAIRGATTVDENTVASLTPRVQEMLLEILKRNDVEHDDVVSALFTATVDLDAAFPATAARGVGFGDIPLICASEIAVPNSTPLCVRVMLHVYSDRPRSAVRHVYLHGAQGLRDDLPT